MKFYPAEEWPARSEEMRDDLSAMGWDEDAMPSWLKTGMAFGEIPHLGNLFVVGVGEDTGKVFYADHDDFRETPIADDLEQLLDKIRNDPAVTCPRFLYQGL